MTTSTNGSLNPVVLSSATTPFTAITVDDPPLTVENISVTLSPTYIDRSYSGGNLNYQYTESSNFTTLGSISDPNGGGTWNAATNTFTEQVAVTGSPTEGTKLIQRLVYTPPALTAGTSNIVSAVIAVNGSYIDAPVPVAPTSQYGNTIGPNGSVLLETVTSPTIQGAVANIPVASPTSTAPTSVRPFATVAIADQNFNSSADLSATITVTDNGVPTDADGLLTGVGLSKSNTLVGVYTFAANQPYTLQRYLSQLNFTPTAVANGATRTTGFELNVVDNGFPGLTADDKTTSVQVIGLGPVTGPFVVGISPISVVPGTATQPFANVTVSDPSSNPQDSATITINVPGGGGVSAAGVGVVSPTSYVIPATTPDQLTSILRALSFVPSGPASSSGTITLDVKNAGGGTAEGTVPIQEVSPPVTPNFTENDISTGQQSTLAGTSYSGPVPGLTQEIILVTTDNVNVTANIPNVFIKTGSGTDAINVSQVGGNNVLDGSTGSNFLTGGSGDDTFYLDDRNPTSDVFSTVVGFHSGDNASVFGVNTSDFTLNELDGQGSSGYTGLDFAFSAPNHANANIVLAGYTTADLTNGRLTVTYGTTSDGTQYMNVHGN
jgi:hypothetical protein